MKLYEALLGEIRKPVPRGALSPKECRRILAGELRAASDLRGEGFRSPNFISILWFKTNARSLTPAPPVVKTLVKEIGSDKE